MDRNIHYILKYSINFRFIRCLWRSPPPCLNMESSWTLFIIWLSPNEIIQSGRWYQRNSINTITPTINLWPHKIGGRELQGWRVLHRQGENLIPSSHLQRKNQKYAFRRLTSKLHCTKPATYIRSIKKGKASSLGQKISFTTGNLCNDVKFLNMGWWTSEHKHLHKQYHEETSKMTDIWTRLNKQQIIPISPA